MSDVVHLPNILFLPDGHRHWAREHDVSYSDAYEIACQRINDCAGYLGQIGMSQCWVGIVTPFMLERSPSDLRDVLDATLRIHEIGKERGQPINVTYAGRLDLLPSHQDRYRAQEAEHTLGAFTVNLLMAWSANNEVVEIARYASEHPTAPMDHNSLVARSAVTERIDLILRFTQNRLSAMVPWHSTDAELALLPIQFPDFTRQDLETVVDDYMAREQRHSSWSTADL